MQEIVPRNKIACTCRTRSRATPWLLAPSRSSPATRDIYLRVDLNYTEQTDVCPARLTAIAQVRANKAASDVDFHPVSDMAHYPCITPPSIQFSPTRCYILTQEASHSLVTSLRLRVSIGDYDALLNLVPRMLLSQENPIKSKIMSLDYVELKLIIFGDMDSKN
ncbi:hypothetical protein EVAR_6040_1 [Eumeta japonica]|uniref:Uncharacterized protein n=1 Tax=Eumeta variegata TaxID=151549 RepID=A0A4C1T9V1_EUMVA|nr:hypothetical protein EVAR_6040_1 [Eumeta japonica]